MITQTAARELPPSLIRKLSDFAADIKIGHTLFALPFALLSAFLAAGGMPYAGQLALILVCMITARTVAMSANRLLDARLDAQNPRTARRALPAGRLTITFVLGMTLASAGGFFGACWLFLRLFANPWPIDLAPLVLAFLCGYPLLKRFTQLCHYYLGAALALAPVCAWLAIRGRVDAPPFWMAGAVLCWTAGFDIIYACQDYASDVAGGVFSVPSRLGIANALWVARITHVACIALLIQLGRSTPALGTLYFIGVGAAACLLAIEHWIVRPDDLSKVGLAFFTVNGVISVLLGTLGIIDVFV